MISEDCIYITGTAVRWGSVQTVEELWRSIREAKTCPEKVPEDRVAPLLSISDKLPKGYWIRDLDQFDPIFFALTPRESFSTEPSQRLSLTCSWEAVEDANLLVEDLQNYGVYSGCSSGDYMSLLAKFDQPENAFFWPIGNTLSGCPGRVAYFLGCKGPSVAVDSACASSLVALGLCFSEMRSRSIDGGLVIGGNAVSSNSLTSILFSNGLLAKDGRCKTFDTLADGFGRADAVAVLVVQSKTFLKCDAWLRVPTVVQGQDSNFKKSFTQTSAKGQSIVIQKALQCCGGSSKDLTLYFPHGNGSPFSDADEISALQDSLSRSQSSLSLALSSSKTITGHSESASGALAVVILCLAMKHREIPRHINFSSINTSIGSKKMETENFSLCLEQTKWDSQYHVAAETSFGLGGSIACAMFKGCSPSVQSSSAQKSSWKTIEICVAHEASFTEAGKKYSEFLIENDVSMEHFVSSFSRRDRSFQKRVYMYSFSKKDLIAGFKAMEKYGAACRGFDGFSKASAISKKQGQIILCCGTFKRKSGVENFDAGLKVGKDLIEHGVVFSKSFFGESALAFAASALLEHCPEKVARQQALSSGQRIKKVVKIFSTTAQASDCFRGCSRWSNYCVASSSRNESLDAAVSMGLRLVASDKTMLNQESYVHLSKYGMSFLLRQARKDDIYVMLGRWDDLWGKVRKDGCVGLHGLMGFGKWQGSSVPLLVSLKVFGKEVKVEELKKENVLKDCIPHYPFQKRKFWPAVKAGAEKLNIPSKAENQRNELEEIYGKCDFCAKDILGNRLVISDGHLFHDMCVEKFDYINQKCSHCGERLGDKARVAHDTQVMHESCFAENFKCSFCNQAISVGKVVQYNNGRYHGHCVVKARQKELKCAVCEGYLEDDYVFLNSERIHPTCLSKKRQKDATAKQELLRMKLKKTEVRQEVAENQVDFRASNAVVKKIQGSSIHDRVLSIICFSQDIHDLKADSSLMELSLTSLSGIKVRTLVQEHTGVLLPSTFTTDFGTVRDVITFVEKGGGELRSPESIEGGIAPSAIEAEEVWKKTNEKITRISSDKSGAKAVFVTGASGFLGSEIVRYLSQMEIVTFCVVRAKSSGDASKRVKDLLGEHFNEKFIKVFAGDLEKEKFGLEQKIYESVGKSCRHVIHAAALVHWTAPYHFLKQANVIGTANVLRFCQEFSMSVAYVSTLGILSPFSQLDKGDEKLDMESFNSVEHWQVLPANQRGYTQSKYVGELLVRKFAESGSAVIIRVPFLGPSSKSGRVSTDQYDVRMVMSIVKSGAYYRPVKRSSKLHWIPVDYCAGCIWRSSEKLKDFKERTGDILLHLVHPMGGTPFSLIIRCLESFGYPLKPISREEWIKETEAQDLPSKPFIDLLKLEMDELHLKWSSCHLNDIQDDFNFPKFSITNSYILQMCQYMAAEKLISSPKPPDNLDVQLDYIIKPLDKGYSHESNDPLLIRAPRAVRNLIQLWIIILLVIVASSPLFPVVLYLDWTFTVAWWGIFLIPLSVPIYSGSLMILIIILKWCLLGKVKPGRHKLWSFFFCRWWFIHRLRNMADLSIVGKLWINGSLFSWIFYRLLGASIHWTASVRCQVYDCDMIEMERDSGSEETLSGHSFDVKGFLVLDKIKLKEGSWVSKGAHVMPGAATPYMCGLLEGTLLTSFDNVKAVPPKCLLRGNDPVQAVPGAFAPNLKHENFALYFVRSLLMLIVRSYMIVGSVAPSIWLFFFIGRTYGGLWNLLSLWGLIPLAAAAYMLGVIILKWLLIGSLRCCLKTASYNWKGWFAFRRDLLLSATEILMEPILRLFAFSTWSNWYMRLMGAKVGFSSWIGSLECGAEWDFLNIGAKSFVGLQVQMKPWKFSDSKLLLNEINVGQQNFIGSFSCLSGSTRLEDFCQVLPGSVVLSGSFEKETQLAGDPSFPLSNFHQKPVVPDGRNIMVDLIFSFCFWAAVSASVVVSFVVVEQVLGHLFLLSSPANIYFFSGCAAVGLMVFLACFGVTLLFTSSIAYHWSAVFSDKRDKNAQIDKFRVMMLGLSSLCASGLGGSSFAAMIWKMLGAKVGCNSYIDTHHLSDPQLFQCDDDCVVLGAVDIGYGESTDFRRIGVVLAKGCVLERNSLVIDGFCSRECVSVLPTAVPDNMTTVRTTGVFRGYIQHNYSSLEEKNVELVKT